MPQSCGSRRQRRRGRVDDFRCRYEGNRRDFRPSGCDHDARGLARDRIGDCARIASESGTVKRGMTMPVQKFAPMTKNFPTFDCDAHVTEPPWLWDRAKDWLTASEYEDLKNSIWFDKDS